MVECTLNEPLGKVSLDERKLCTDKVFFRKINGLWKIEIQGEAITEKDFNLITRALKSSRGVYRRLYTLSQRTKQNNGEVIQV